MGVAGSAVRRAASEGWKMVTGQPLAAAFAVAAAYAAYLQARQRSVVACIVTGSRLGQFAKVLRGLTVTRPYVKKPSGLDPL